jgi:hypothetical protein
VTDPVTLTGQDGAPYLAVDVQPDNVAGVFRLDHSRLDGADRLSWGVAAGQWVNIVCDVFLAHYRRGVSQLGGVVPQVETGTCTIRLSDTEHVFDPMTSGDVIHRGSPLRIRGWGTDLDGELWEAVLFTGVVDRVRVQYLHDGPPDVTITGMDVAGQLAAWHSEGYPDGERPDVLGMGYLGQHVELVLEETGMGELSPASHTNYMINGGQYAAPLLPMPMARPWQELLDRQEAELGRLWIDRHNQLVVRGRGSQLDGPVRGTFSDTHGETLTGPHCCVADAAVIYGVRGVNRVLAGRQKYDLSSFPDMGPDDELVRRDNAASIARHGPEVIERRDLPISYEVDSSPPLYVPTYRSLLPAWADAVLAGGATPRVGVESVQPAPSPVDLDSALQAWPAVLATDVGDRWVFLFHPTPQLLVAQTVGVLGVELEATPEQWTLTWTTEESRSAELDLHMGLFVLDHSALDGTARLGP